MASTDRATTQQAKRVSLLVEVVQRPPEWDTPAGPCKTATRKEERCAMLLVYWGRRGPIGGFALDLARAALAAGETPVLSVAREGETFKKIEQSGIPLVPVRTFTSAAGSLVGVL